MSGLKDIGVKVVTSAPAEAREPDGDGYQGAYALAILHEIKGMLEGLARAGKEDSIDLRSLPTGPGDYQRLKQLLGQGEVSATVEAMGPTRIYETVYPGVWWVTHFNADEEVIADRIEVTLQPQMLKSHPSDVTEGLERLRSCLQET
jgi:HupH hydrogenase expression protein